MPGLSTRILLTSFLGMTLCMTMGCRRNLMRIHTVPEGAQVYVQGKVVRLEDYDRDLAQRIDEKKKREKPLTEDERAFDRDRKRLQMTPVEYEFDSIACGYSIYCLKKGFSPMYHVEYVKPRWYEYPPIDMIVDVLPFQITDTREVTIPFPGEAAQSQPSE
jgi:hypothetical protein